MRKRTYEFVVPSQVWIIDADPWQPLEVNRGGLVMRVLKPLTGSSLSRAIGTIGNEGLVVEFSIVRVEVDLQDAQTEPEWYVPFQVVRELLAWIRAMGRQYWVAARMSGTESVTRGSIISEDGSYKNFAATQTPVFVPPLTQIIWNAIGREISVGNAPSITDLLFCDAMISFRDHDYLQAVIQFAITCELELNAFIDDLLSLHPEAMSRMYRASRPQFDWKLKNMPELLGCESYQSHDRGKAEQLCKLYELRGAAVHRAICVVADVDQNSGEAVNVPVGFGHVSTFMFAVEDFLGWTKQQRLRRGLAAVSPSSASVMYTLGPR